jgi:hypothetical protein
MNQDQIEMLEEELEAAIARVVRRHRAAQTRALGRRCN